ncbi:MAG: ThiF family adenylyltransferase, partial [Planctomycetales bacterium]
MVPDPDDSNSDDSNPLERYARQTRFAPFGEEGQRRLLESRVLVCGCGALGTYSANTLARAGVGTVRIVDRDFVDLTNLQRQVLFDEQDVADCMPKAIAAAEKLRRINSEIEIEPVVADVDYLNIAELCDGADVIVDGTDNFETRFLLNDASINFNIPWVYGGCLGAEGQTMTILPGETPCLRCLMHEAPPPGTTPTCDTAGIMASAIGVVASIQSLEAIKILSGNRDAVNRELIAVDLWDNRMRQVQVAALKESGACPTCGSDGSFSYLEGAAGSRSTVLCGRNAVQLSHAARDKISLDELAEKLDGVGQVSRNPFLLRLTVDDYVLTVFPDGRAIIVGT